LETKRELQRTGRIREAGRAERRKLGFMVSDVKIIHALAADARFSMVPR
jgi:hypothetical protein